MDAGTYWWVVLPSDEGLSTPSVYAAFDRLHPDLPVGGHHDQPPGLLHALAGVVLHDFVFGAVAGEAPLQRIFSEMVRPREGR